MTTTPTTAASGIARPIGQLLPIPSPDATDAGDLVKLAADHLYAGTENSDPDPLTAATAYALVAIADSLHRLADRLAPDVAALTPARDDR